MLLKEKKNQIHSSCYFLEVTNLKCVCPHKGGVARGILQVFSAVGRVGKKMMKKKN